MFPLLFSLFYGNVVFAASLTVHNVDTGLSYASIQEAIDAVETLDGHTIFVDAGVYYENVVVNKSLTLAGEDGGTTIIDGGEGLVIMVEASNTVVKGFTIRNRYPYNGIHLYHVSGSSVYNNNIDEGNIGAKVTYSPGSRIYNNNIHSNMMGVMVLHSCRSRVFNNRITGSGVYSLAVGYSSDSSVFCNNITDGASGLYVAGGCDISILGNNIMNMGYWGIALENASGCTINQNSIINSHIALIPGSEDSFNSKIYHNNITQNEFGIILYDDSFNNKIYHNNFVNNSKNVESYNQTSMWDDGYPSGGNYWSDYNETDLYCGPIQNETGSDGIGDTPYIIDENNMDMYPLMEPYSWVNVLAVERVRLERTTLCQGLTTKIDVDIINCGRFTETFNLTLYINTTVFDKTEVTLVSIDATTLTYTWDTAGFAKGNYTIRATATPVQGEIEVLDNTCTCWAIVSMVGDLTGADSWPDGEVDMRDIGVAARAFGSYPGHDRWNLEADITGPEYLVPDNDVDMRDIALIARHFGETDP